jgi:hypothetical protein
MSVHSTFQQGTADQTASMRQSPWKSNSRSAIQKILKFYCRVYKSPPLAPILNQNNAVHNLSPNFIYLMDQIFGVQLQFVQLWRAKYLSWYTYSKMKETHVKNSSNWSQGWPVKSTKRSLERNNSLKVKRGRRPTALSWVWNLGFENEGVPK